MIEQEIYADCAERLDQEHIETLAEAIKVKLANGYEGIEVAYMPGDATWYALVFARLPLVGAPGGGSMGSWSSYIGRERIFVTWLQQSTWTSFDETDDPVWVAGKLSPDNVASQVALTELLKAVM